MRKIFYSIFILLFFFSLSRVNAQSLPTPVLLTPPDWATGVSLFPTFTWSPVSGATYYRIQVGTGPSDVLDVSNITTTSYTVVQNVLTGLTTYYWRIKAYNATSESNWATYFHFTTAPAIPPSPVLVSPANNATNVSVTPLLDWNDASGAETYRVQIATDISFTNIVMNVAGLTNSAYQVPSSTLLNNNTYYWHVNATNAGGTSPWSTTWQFSTVTAPPPAPSLVYPTNGATGIATNVTLNWNDVVGVTGYRIQVSQNNAFTAIMFDSTSTISQITIPTGILSGTTPYYWRVYAYNIAGPGPWSAIWSFTTGTAPPAAPLLLLPTNGQTSVPIQNVNFDWSSVSGATSYRIQVSLSSDFGTTFINTQVTSSQYTHTNPVFAYNTIYYWRVNSSNGAGAGVWSQVWSFTTAIAPPVAPTLVSPTNGQQNIPLTPYMDWSDVPSATSYILQISTSNSFSSFALNVEVPLVSNYTVPSGILQGYTTYYWRVAAKNSGGTSPNSTVWNFRTVQTFNLNLKVYLEGMYNGTTQVQDTIKVILAQNVSPYAGMDTSLAVLQSNGQINGISYAKASSGFYYIVVKHRNHIETWSANAYSFSTGSTVSFNFTDALNKAYGNNMKLVGSGYVFIAGDANQDGFVNSADYELFKTQFGSWGYLSGDYNGDWFVDGVDYPCQNNFGESIKKPQ